MGQLITAASHGLSPDDTIMLGNLVGGEGLDENTVYYVLADGLTTDVFKVSLTSGGAAIEFTTDITDGVIVYTDTYVPEDGVMAPPTTLSVPDDPTVTETSSAGLLRLSIELAAYADAAVRVRLHEAHVTSKYLDSVALAGALTGAESTDE
jgi:hypothetical protein